MEAFLATVLDEVLVAADPRRLESLRGELLQLIRHKMDREGELVNTSPLPSQVKDDLGVNSAITRLFSMTGSIGSSSTSQSEGTFLTSVHVHSLDIPNRHQYHHLG